MYLGKMPSDECNHLRQFYFIATRGGTNDVISVSRMFSARNITSLSPTSAPTIFQTPTVQPTSTPTIVPTLNYNTASEVMSDLKGKYKKILRAGLNVAWKSNSNVEVEINNTNPVGNISYMVLEIYDDDDCSKPVMQAG